MVTNVVGKIDIPTFTSEESRVRHKIKVGIDLTELDYHVLVSDVKNKLKDGKYTVETIRNYIENKYLGFNVDAIMSRL